MFFAVYSLGDGLHATLVPCKGGSGYWLLTSPTVPVWLSEKEAEAFLADPPPAASILAGYAIRPLSQAVSAGASMLSALCLPAAE